MGIITNLFQELNEVIYIKDNIKDLASYHQQEILTVVIII